MACTGEGCHVVVKHTFWDLEDDEVEEFAVQRPRAMTDSALLRFAFFNDATDDDDDDGNCTRNDNLSSVETDTGSSVGENCSQSPPLWSDSDEEEISHASRSSIGEICSQPSRPLWSDIDEKETAASGPPGTFCQMASLQWIPVAVPLPGKTCFAEANVKACRTEPKPRHSKLSHNSEPTKAKQTVLRALKKARQTVQAAQ